MARWFCLPESPHFLISLENRQIASLKCDNPTVFHTFQVILCGEYCLLALKDKKQYSTLVASANFI